MNSEPINSEKKRYRLPVGKIQLGALYVSWANRLKLIKGLIPTGLLIVAIDATWRISGISLHNPLAIIFVAALLLLFAKFSVTCHRLVLVEFKTGDQWILPFSWSDRESYFLIRMLLVLAVVLIGSFIISLVPLTMVLQSLPPGQRENPEALFPFSVLFAGIPALYLLARLSLLFPATAVDAITGLDRAWNISRGNGLKIMVIIGPIPWLGGLLKYFILSALPGLFAEIISELISYIFIVIEITALSLAYRELTLQDQK